MTSTTNTVRLHASDGGGDEDEDFDWEAAVREIDVACQNATNNNNPSSSSFHFAADNRRKTWTCKQSTLDRFVGKVGPRPASRTEYPPAATVSAGGRWVQVEEEEEEVRFVQEGEERVGSVQIDAEAAKTWIYPVNIPLRDYQLAITKTALFSNTLVALPTGLGKTLIAAVVMYNYFRWFPDGKIVFAAPSRPLVMQQIEACHNIVGIPQEWTIDMTGQINPTRRADFWKTKRVFFVTPQVLEKDIQAGTCLARYLVCLVIDEAHRALGNYSYCVAVRELMSLPVQLRILALTATPGSKQQAIQHIIDNLQISTLEYRNESDPDVIPYVHNRKIELIEVPMGQNALDINKRLLDVIRPYVARLSAIGLLQNRDFQTLSPPDLLNSRDKFRQAPPPGLPQNRYGEIEAYFGGLITLYHVRKLLSSHGIRPAYEMLEEKLKQGPFARLMSKNEDIRKVKLLMLQSLSHGAPSPKLSKMLEVLVDHFKTKDPKQSRVIIFSNFRGSVRDIMTALSNIGDLVKATEFIGQSSGKALKGQSQKVQQAVLKKFRSGGYNVIVATSIGEEGLDIMEVDLVICFDANVSPLRMIQRMGRTGRKHDGRVVVLACEGSELKGYMRKQANGRTIRKHMHNGGINSFTFHCSPRMIPHIFKPEVQFVELSIEQYVPHGRKVKDDNAMQTPVFNEKLTDAETALISKYFQSTRGSTWRSSLIAFPRFQAFPSRVYKVMHSYRTNMLIDTMQHLQGLSFSRDNRSPIAQDELISSTCREADTVGMEENTKEDLLTLDDSPSIKSQKNVTDFELSPGMAFAANKNNSVLGISDQCPPAHSFLFGSNFVSVGPFGKVHIMSVPCLLLKDVTNSQNLSSNPMVLLNHMKKNLSGVKTLSEDYEEPATVAKLELKTRSWTQSKTSCNSQQVNTLNQVEKVLETPILKRNMSDVETYAGKPLDPAETKALYQQADEYRDPELSPRLTNMIQSGVVPESPIDNSGLSNVEGRREFHVPDVSPVKFCTELLPTSPVARKIENAIDSCAHQGNENVSPISKGLHTTLNKTKSIPRTGGCSSISPIAEECNTPLANLSKTSCSEDWILSSGEKSGHAKQVSKLKRLRKLGDIGKSRNLGDGKKISPFSIPNNERPFSGSSPNLIKHGKKHVTNVKVFIEEEAEVSSGSEVSDDEEDDNDSAYDNSFIDDKISPTATTAQAEANRVDMMAIYRRSLLSQSPLERAFSSSAFTPECGDPVSRLDESGSCSFKTSYSLNTLKTDSANQSTKGDSESFQPNSERISVATCANNIRASATELETRKRKLSYRQSWSIPAVNLESEFSLVTEPPGEDLVQQGSTKKIDDDGETLHDDQFFASLDLDAVEAQANLLLKHRTEVPVQNQDLVSNGDDHPNVNLNNSPSFDLGIW